MGALSNPISFAIRISKDLIRAPQVPFLVPPKTPILGVFGYFGGTEKGLDRAPIEFQTFYFSHVLVVPSNMYLHIESPFIDYISFSPLF